MLWMATGAVIAIQANSREETPARAGGAAPAEIRPTNAVDALLDAFDRYPVVALGEAHGLAEEREFLCTLVRDPRFAEKVNDIVVEFGNSRYQDLLDRYVAGEEVPAGELQRVWRDHTSPGPWTSSAYAQYFAAFREVNRKLPRARCLHVLAADPPIDWAKVQNASDFAAFLAQRDAHMAKVVEERVLAKGRKCLLIAGSLHLLRQELPGPAGFGPRTFTKSGPPGDKRDADSGKFFGPVPVSAGPAGASSPVDGGNVARRVDKQYPGKMLVVIPHDGLGESSAEVEKRFDRWPVPSLAALPGTWLGAQSATSFLASPKQVKFFRNGKTIDPPKIDPAKAPRLEAVADALLYLGPRETLHSDPDVDLSQDKEFVAELKRRRTVAGGPMLLRAGDEKNQSRRYIDR
jgi:hypothetical protein